MQKDTRYTYKPNKEATERIEKIMAVDCDLNGVSSVINEALRFFFDMKNIGRDYFAMVEQGHAKEPQCQP
jgi:hypothetical protein